MKWGDVQLLVSYSQVNVFNTDLQDPFNDWTDTHVQQGFSWREGSVSFGALSDWESKISVGLGDEIYTNEQAIRSIVVPFHVEDNGITVTSILSEEFIFDIPQGSYELLFHAIPLESQEKDLFKVRYEITFVSCATPSPRILKYDSELLPPKNLCMKAEPAV
ncbi:Competence protein J (ComJ) [Thermoactinomyces sp. DSM 45891]|uniref:competence protein ComJ n=1 Tax=Thermoactinomyces sp. DSM 45891 TaxID=1761907 RepID=UPI00091FDFF2|nr:competence protein ComJ [Thermoactinomyces sp. DSM 45891]SFX68243.1 Competence protein J (ComJ) [Thermoactinomyces sp. DSM 45891]